MAVVKISSAARMQIRADVFKTKCSPMSNPSNAKILSHSALWQEAFGVSPSPVRPFVFYAGTRVDADRKPIYDQCIIGYGVNEAQARSSAEAILYGKVGHNGYHIGEKIPVI